MKGGRTVNDSVELNESVRNAVVTYSDNLVKVAFSYLKNKADAEEIVQEVFIAYLQKNPVFESKEHEKAWLIRTTINKCKNILKTSWFRSRATLTDELPYMPHEDQTVLQAVLSLKKKYRIPIHLHYYEGYSLEEIANILQTKPATVGTWLARGRQQLKIEIGGLQE